MGGMAVIMPTYKAKLAWLSFSILLCGLRTLAQSQEPPVAASATSDQRAAPAASARESLPEPQSSGSISGTVVDATGAFIVGARVSITSKDLSPNREVLSADDGQF